MIWNYDKVYNAEVFIFFMVDGDSYIKFLLNLVVMLMVNVSIILHLWDIYNATFNNLRN